MLQALQTDTEKRDVSSQTSTAQIVSVTTGTTNAGDATLTRREATPIEEAEKKMRHAWAAGIVVGIVTTALTAVVLGFAEGGAVTANGGNDRRLEFFPSSALFCAFFFHLVASIHVRRGDDVHLLPLGHAPHGLPGCNGERAAELGWRSSTLCRAGLPRLVLRGRSRRRALPPIAAGERLRMNLMLEA